VRGLDGSVLVDPEFVPIASGFHFVQDKMDELQRAAAASFENEFATSGVVVDKVIHLDVRHPEVPVLDLVDLPGMILTDESSHPKKREAVESIYDQQIAMDQVEGCTSIYLAIVPSPSLTHRPNANGALRYIQTKGLMDRTIGVFTKADGTQPDELSAFVTGEPFKEVDDNGSVRKIADPVADLGAVTLPDGWVTTMLQPPANADRQYYAMHGYERLKKMENDEKVYFGGEGCSPTLRELYDHGKAGSGALAALLQAKYYGHVRGTWLMETLRRLCEHELMLRHDRALLGEAHDVLACNTTKQLLAKAGETCRESYIHTSVMAELGPKLGEMLTKIIGNETSRHKMEVTKVDRYLAHKAADMKLLIGTVIDMFTDVFVNEVNRQLHAKVQVFEPLDLELGKTTATTWEKRDGTIVRALLGTHFRMVDPTRLPSASSSVEDEGEEAGEEPLAMEATRAAAEAACPAAEVDFPVQQIAGRAAVEVACAPAHLQPHVALAPVSANCAFSDKDLHMLVVTTRPVQLAHFPEYSKAITDRVVALCNEKASLIKQVTGELVDQFVSPMSPYLQFTPLSDCKHIGFSWKHGENRWDARCNDAPSIMPGSAKPFIDTVKTAIIHYLPTPEQLMDVASHPRLSDFPEDPAIVTQRKNIDECLRRVQCTTRQLVDVLDVDPEKPLKPILEELQKTHGLHCDGGISAVGMAESPPDSPPGTSSPSPLCVESPQ